MRLDGGSGPVIIVGTAKGSHRSFTASFLELPGMMVPILAWLVLLGAPAPGEAKTPETVRLSGQVIELTDALKATGLKVDAEPIAKQVVLRDKGNTLTPLLSDDASRAFFTDPRLRDRPVELSVKRLASLPYVQVLSFQVLVEGKLRTPEYYCEICTISVRYPQICPCCQGPMELRMKPETR